MDYGDLEDGAGPVCEAPKHEVSADFLGASQAVEGPLQENIERVRGVVDVIDTAVGDGQSE